MRYFYEYEYKNGCKVGGHNLKTIKFFDNYIILYGEDIIQTIYGIENDYWGTKLDMNEIKYLIIKPMNYLDKDDVVS